MKSGASVGHFFELSNIGMYFFIKISSLGPAEEKRLLFALSLYISFYKYFIQILRIKTCIEHDR